MTVKTEGALDIPERIPFVSRRSQIAAVPRMKDKRIDYLTRKGRILTINDQFRNPCGWKEYSPEHIAEFAKCRGIVLSWHAVKD